MSANRNRKKITVDTVQTFNPVTGEVKTEQMPQVTLTPKAEISDKAKRLDLIKADYNNAQIALRNKEMMEGWVSSVHEKMITAQDEKDISSILMLDGLTITDAFRQYDGTVRVDYLIAKLPTGVRRDRNGIVLTDRNGRDRVAYRYYLVMRRSDGQIAAKGLVVPLSKAEARRPIDVANALGAATDKRSWAKRRWEELQPKYDD
jgi:hypothetical protein